MTDIEGYAYLWNEPEGHWVLVEDSSRPAIFNRDTRQILLIEDEADYWAVVDRMRTAGVPRVTSFDPPEAQ